MLFELFNSICIKRASVTGVKAAVTEIRNKKTIFEDKKKDELANNVIDPKKNLDYDKLLIDWLDFFLASSRVSINNSGFINTQNNDGQDS